MPLTLEQVRHVAALARLALTDEEERRYQQQLGAILDAAGALAQVDTSAVEPTSHATAAVVPVVRPDEPHPSLPPEVAVANAPAAVETSFSVPKIIE